jgi:hypothetical protein
MKPACKPGDLVIIKIVAVSIIWLFFVLLSIFICRRYEFYDVEIVRKYTLSTIFLVLGFVFIKYSRYIPKHSMFFSESKFGPVLSVILGIVSIFGFIFLIVKIWLGQV